MRVADYIMQFLENMGISHVFMLSGGGIMYLTDALGRSHMKYVCCHHEQAAGIAAQAYAMEKNSMSVCMITTGPGGTNALTAAGAAYMDSTPVLFLSGQVKTTDAASMRQVRQFGAQENDIVAMAAPVMKYAVTVTKAEKIRYHLEKAIFLALHGRKGPVWLDIPLDVQNAIVCSQELVGFDELETSDMDLLAEQMPGQEAVETVLQQILNDLCHVKRPLILIGHGVVASGAQELFYDVHKKTGIPVLATWRAAGIMDTENELFFGSPGLQAVRYSNLILQGTDMLIVIGSRLDNMITAFNEEHFAFRAKKYIVDIDTNEIDKLKMTNVTPIVCDAAYFMEKFSEKLDQIFLPGYGDWVDFCQKLKARYPLSGEKQQYKEENVDLYRITEKISECCTANDVVVISSTSRCNTAGYLAFLHKKGQKILSSMGFGSMGFALPSVTGAWFASGGRRIVMLEGDGSFQLNLQELQTIVHHQINAKLFVFRNQGYAAISAMQDRNFEGFHIGCDVISGVTMPDLEKISAAYDIPFYRIDKEEEADEQIKQIMGGAGPVICELVGSIAFDEIPKCISYLNEDGKRVSALLENPYPFLTEQEMEDIYKDYSGASCIIQV